MSPRLQFPYPLLLAAILIIPAAIVLTFSAGKLQIPWTAAHSVARQPSTHKKFHRVEDLPLAAQSTDDLPLAPFTRGRVVYPDEVTPEMVRKADEFLWNEDPPYGAEQPIDVAGKNFIARIERHFHEIGGPKRPWGWHKGVTLYQTE